ncbi:MAG: hypothetical protein U5K56_20695 [Halioglobus sp.]|nr:hypothetical protein [Halioglobus sp.]
MAILLALSGIVGCSYTDMVSVHSNGNPAGQGGSSYPGLSQNGRYVVFASFADNLVDGDTNSNTDVFVHDTLEHTTTRVSVNSSGDQTVDPFPFSNGGSNGPEISADGRFISFISLANNLVSDDTGLFRDVFVHDRDTGETIRASVDSDGNQIDSDSRWPAISGNGENVAFHNFANLIMEDPGYFGIYRRNIASGALAPVSVNTAGDTANALSRYPRLSHDGMQIVFESTADNLGSDDNNGKQDIFVRDIAAGTTTRVSVDTDGNETNDSSFDGDISPDGRYVVFATAATNLGYPDNNGGGRLLISRPVGRPNHPR